MRAVFSRCAGSPRDALIPHDIRIMAGRDDDYTAYEGWYAGYEVWTPGDAPLAGPRACGPDGYPVEDHDGYPAGASRGDGHEVPGPSTGSTARVRAASASGSAQTPGSAGAAITRPLTMALIGPNFQIGGVRQHAISLAKFLDPGTVRITEFVVADPAPGGATDPGLPAPVSHADPATLGRVARENDVLLLWGGGFDRLLVGPRPLCVFVAHGETGWARSGLEKSRGVVDHVIAVSDRVRRSVCQGFPTTTILNGVDAARLATTRGRGASRRRFAFGPRDFVLGSVGRFTGEKRHELLIDAVERLPPRFKLLLVGAGRRHAELCSYANDRIPGRFAAATAHDGLGDYYGVMDAFALVSAHEGFGLVLAEAMMCGRPVLATEVGAVPEIVVDRVRGLVVAPRAEAIADAARLLAAHPRWARGMAAEGRAFAERHLHARRMAEDYQALLLSLVAGRRAARSEGRP